MAFNSYIIIHIANNNNFERACVGKDRGFICNAWLQRRSLPRVKNSNKAMKGGLKWLDI